MRRCMKEAEEEDDSDGPSGSEDDYEPRCMAECEEECMDDVAECLMGAVVEADDDDCDIEGELAQLESETAPGAPLLPPPATATAPPPPPPALATAPPPPQPAPTAQGVEDPGLEMSTSKSKKEKDKSKGKPKPKSEPASISNPEQFAKALKPFLVTDKGTDYKTSYNQFVALRMAHPSQPSYYFYAAEAFRDHGAPALMCERIVSNVLENCLPSAQACRSVAYFLISLSRLDKALELLEVVVEMAPDEPQSYCDLALTNILLIRRQHAANKNIDKAELASRLTLVVSHLVKVILGSWETRFSEIEWPAVLLLSWICNWSDFIGLPSAWPSELDAAKYRIKELKNKVFVWLGWDTDHTDIDLHVQEPSGEEVCYSHSTSSGTNACISRDFTEGYGPECYVCVHALPGTYRVSTDYYGSHQDSATTGATSAIVWSVKFMGDFNKEEMEFTTQRLTKEKQREPCLVLTVK